jgi:hypothetical protein
MTTDSTFDIGPTPPPLTLPGAQPNWDSLTPDGTTVLAWTRDIGDQVWIAAEDTIAEGQWLRSPAVVGFCEPPRDGLDAAGARQLAAELLNAADELDRLSTPGRRVEHEGVRLVHHRRGRRRQGGDVGRCWA